MKNLGNYYGATLLEKTDLLEINSDNKILLEYYSIKRYIMEKTKLKIFYGITVVKKEYKRDKVNYEKKSIVKISTKEEKTKNILKVLKQNQVTPIGLNDVVTDLLKLPQFVE